MIIRVALYGQIALQRPDEFLLQPARFQDLNMGEPVEQQRQDLVLVGRLAAQRDAVLLLLQQLLGNGANLLI
ncbi:hypothetical protein KAM546c_05640 [Enterobacter roggenkampii]|nr:hypothetical protein KAM546c_05640 [Enterobacter roggenkampii]